MTKIIHVSNIRSTFINIKMQIKFIPNSQFNTIIIRKIFIINNEFINMIINNKIIRNNITIKIWARISRNKPNIETLRKFIKNNIFNKINFPIQSTIPIITIRESGIYKNRMNCTKNQMTVWFYWGKNNSKIINSINTIEIKRKTK